jgi:hypothetical protein
MTNQVNVRTPGPGPDASTRQAVPANGGSNTLIAPAGGLLLGRPSAGLARLAAPGAAGVLQRVVVDLQRTAGNRAVGHMRPKAPSPPVQRDDLSRGGAGYKRGGGEQIETSFVIAEPAGIKVTFKFTASRKGSKVLESPTYEGPGGVESRWSLGENKVAFEHAAGKWGAKLTSTLARVDWSHPVIPGFKGLKVRVTAKGPEGKLDLKKFEADLDLFKASLSIDGDVPELLDWMGLVNLKDRVSIKASITAEKGLSVRDLARIRSAILYKNEAELAAKEAEKHAADFAKYRTSLERLKAKRPGLKLRVANNKEALEKAAKALEEAESRPGTGARALRALRTQKAAAERALVKAETALYRNRQFTRVSARFLRGAREGLVQAGERLARSGRQLSATLKGVVGKFAEPIKKAIEKVTARIMRKLAGTLLAKGLKYLIPGLNLLMTAYDIGSVLVAIFGSSKGGQVGGGGGDDEEGTDGGPGEKGTKGVAGATPDAGDAQGGSTPLGGGAGGTPDAKGQQGGRTPTAEGGSGTATSTGAQAGTGGPGPKTSLSATAKQVLAALNGDQMTLDDDGVRAINEAIPTDLEPADLQKLIDGLAARSSSIGADPYELAAEIQAEAAAVRAGEATITFPGEGSKAMPKPDDLGKEPPKSLLPVTRTDVMNVLRYEAKSGTFALEPAFAADYRNHSLPHPDGLQVKLTAFDIATSQPSGSDGALLVKVTIGLQVVGLPPSAGTSYPWKLQDTAEEKMTFIYDPKRQLWGEMDYSHIAQLRAALTRRGNKWEVTSSAPVHFEYATVVVKKVVGSPLEVVGKDGGKVYRLALEVVPTEITSKRAGYTSSQGWIEFKLNQPTVIPFEISEGRGAKVP